jgi:hypothetical protein
VCRANITNAYISNNFLSAHLKVFRWIHGIELRMTDLAKHLAVYLSRVRPLRGKSFILPAFCLMVNFLTKQRTSMDTTVVCFILPSSGIPHVVTRPRREYARSKLPSLYAMILCFPIRIVKHASLVISTRGRITYPPIAREQTPVWQGHDNRLKPGCR